MLDYFNSSEHANNILKTVVNMMVKHKINPTPINYAVIYEYCLTNANTSKYKNTDFMTCLNALFDGQNTIDDVSLLKIYRKYIKYVPETSIEIIDHLHDFPRMVNHFVEKFNNYAAYQVSLSYKDDSNYHLEKQKLLDELYQLDKEINNLNYLHDRIQELVSSGGVDMLQDAFTGLYTDHEIISDFNHRHKHNQIFYMLVIAIDGVTEVKHNFGDQIEEAIARHFVKIVKPLIPDSLRLYRWMADDIYIMMSASQEELEKIENDIKAVFISKQLLHKPTATNLNETLKIKSSITKALKYFKQSIKQAKQQLKF